MSKQRYRHINIGNVINERQKQTMHSQTNVATGILQQPQHGNINKTNTNNPETRMLLKYNHYSGQRSYQF